MVRDFRFDYEFCMKLSYCIHEYQYGEKKDSFKFTFQNVRSRTMHFFDQALNPGVKRPGREADHSPI
jgi:hypothetical protein